MKYLIVFVLTCFLFFTSCVDDNLQSEDLTSEPEQAEVFTNNISPDQGVVDVNDNKIAVTKVSSSQTASELIVDFTTNYDFSATVLINTQDVVFVNGNGNESTVSLNVNSYTGGSGTLQVTFSTLSASLGGLDLKDAQFIVIEEDFVN